MTKTELIKALQNETGMSESETLAVVELFFGGMLDSLSKEKRHFCVPKRVDKEGFEVQQYENVRSALRNDNGRGIP